MMGMSKNLICPACHKQSGLENTPATRGMYCGKCGETTWFDGEHRGQKSTPKPKQMAKGNALDVAMEPKVALAGKVDSERPGLPDFQEFAKQLSVSQKDGTRVPFEINKTQEAILDFIKKNPAHPMVSFKGRGKPSTGQYVVKNGRVVRRKG